MRLIRLTLIMLLVTVPLTACLQYEAKRGVEVKWQTDVTGQLEKGKSTRGDVMELPPIVIESIAAGTPVIGYAVGGVASQLCDDYSQAIEAGNFVALKEDSVEQ